ncbi:putative endonuclease lcl3 [Linnemannia hyalina]|uniref:Endonuclease lcl3 n=1 Tax=Linnemannia hyalina TaxID=64524 RepID=A0A9P8BVA3_9FUNG|nr:putative endonuclease lcl3 [Linnemannia hyalina]
MVWPFSSSSSSKSNDKADASAAAVASAQGILEHAGEDAKAFVASTKQHLERDIQTAERAIKTASEDFDLPPLPPAPITIPPSLEPYLIASAVFGVATTAVLFYKKNLRRIPSAAYLTPNMLKGKRIMKGRVTSVGDSDNFRFYHTPGGIWAGWGWLRHVPSGTKALKDQTLHIRIAGVDAPEGAHFGMPSQPFSAESLAWLRKELLGKKVTIQPYSKDRYGRVVSMAWYPRSLPFLPKKNVSKEILKAGYGEIYRQSGSEHGGILKELEKIEKKAKKNKVGIWSQKDRVSAADHKKQHLRGGE